MTEQPKRPPTCRDFSIKKLEGDRKIYIMSPKLDEEMKKALRDYYGTKETK
jgi:hypothetical protein